MAQALSAVSHEAGRVQLYDCITPVRDRTQATPSRSDGQT
jgi:hypothetical protein